MFLPKSGYDLLQPQADTFHNFKPQDPGSKNKFNNLGFSLGNSICDRSKFEIALKSDPKESEEMGI